MIREIPQKVEAQPSCATVDNGYRLALLRRTRTNVFLGCLFAVGSTSLLAPQQSAFAASSESFQKSYADAQIERAKEIRRTSSRDPLSLIESAQQIREELRQTKIENVRKSALVSSGSVVHKVKSGETLAGIASRYDVSVETLIQTNDLRNPNELRMKDAIVVPTSQVDGRKKQSFRVPRSAQSSLLIASVDDGAIATGKPQDLIPLENERTDSHRAIDLDTVRKNLKASRQDKKQQDEETLALTPTDTASLGFGTRPETTKVIPPVSRPGLDLLDIPVAARGPLPNLPDLELPTLDSDKYLPSEWQGSGTVRFIWPAKGTFTSGYGWRWGRMHRGIDIAAPTGTPVVASAPGVVTYSRYNNGGYGNLVEVTHPDGSLTLYAHNHRNLVKQGQYVSQGQKIAEMGSTGRSTGPHTHFELHKPGQGAINPVALLKRK